MSHFNELPNRCIKATPKRNNISLSDLKHQLLLNPKMTAQELYDQLDGERCLDFPRERKW